MYWSTDHMFGNQFAHKVMKRDRFDKISQYLHASDTTSNPPRGQPNHDRLAHVRGILENIRIKCINNFHPHQNVSIDEAMIAFRGRLGWRQYMPGKPTKYGIKAWVRADPHTGYLNDFQIYTGKNGEKQEFGLGGRVVKDLTRDITGVNHIVNCDNYFTSPELFESLLADGLYARGTVRENRKGYPKGMLNSDLKQQGQSVSAQKGEMVATRWRDKRIICFLSTIDNGTEKTSVLRKSREGNGRLVDAPIVVKQYNEHMNGVDRHDQVRTEYSTYRKSIKWWQYIFWFLFDVSIANGYILMRESKNHQLTSKNGRSKRRDQLSFRQALANQLIGQTRFGRKRSITPNIDPDGSSHWPVKGPRGRCRWCVMQGRGRREPAYRCDACNVPLCITCFKPYHAAKQ